MFSFLKKKNTGVTVVKESLDDIVTIEDDNSDDSNISSSQDSVENVARTSTGFVATESARISTQSAAQKFAKPTKYNRKILDDGAAKLNAKKYGALHYRKSNYWRYFSRCRNNDICLSRKKT